MSRTTEPRPPDERIPLLHSLPFAGFHVAAAVGVALVGVSPRLLVAAGLGYLLRMWAVTTGYHRYFSHRSFKTSRAFQLFLALVGSFALQKGPLWWADHHRWHHGHSDQPEDAHSPRLRGFLWAHMGWILCPKFESTDADRVRDLMVFPELRWIDRFYLVPPLLFNAALWWLFGPAVFVWAGLVGTVMSWHLLFTANSVCHLYGWRRFDTGEGSRNNPLLGVLLLGEGWHNNHHRLASAARQGFYWWEIDLSYYLLRLLQALRIVWDVREVPVHVLDEGRKLLRN